MTSCSLSCTSSFFCKGIYFKRKNLLGANSFLLKVAPFAAGKQSNFDIFTSLEIISILLNQLFALGLSLIQGYSPLTPGHFLENNFEEALTLLR